MEIVLWGGLQMPFVILLAMRRARFFAGQFAAPTAGAPGKARGVAEEGFQSRYARRYDADRFFETREGSVQGMMRGVVRI